MRSYMNKIGSKVQRVLAALLCACLLISYNPLFQAVDTAWAVDDTRLATDDPAANMGFDAHPQPSVSTDVVNVASTSGGQAGTIINAVTYDSQMKVKQSDNFAANTDQLSKAPFSNGIALTVTDGSPYTTTPNYSANPRTTMYDYTWVVYDKANPSAKVTINKNSSFWTNPVLSFSENPKGVEECRINLYVFANGYTDGGNTVKLENNHVYVFKYTVKDKGGMNNGVDRFQETVEGEIILVTVDADYYAALTVGAQAPINGTPIGNIVAKGDYIRTDAKLNVNEVTPYDPSYTDPLQSLAGEGFIPLGGEPDEGKKLLNGIWNVGMTSDSNQGMPYLDDPLTLQLPVAYPTDGSGNIIVETFTGGQQVPVIEVMDGYSGVHTGTVKPAIWPDKIKNPTDPLGLLIDNPGTEGRDYVTVDGVKYVLNPTGGAANLGKNASIDQLKAAGGDPTKGFVWLPANPNNPDGPGTWCAAAVEVEGWLPCTFAIEYTPLSGSDADGVFTVDPKADGALATMKPSVRHEYTATSTVAYTTTLADGYQLESIKVTDNNRMDLTIVFDTNGKATVNGRSSGFALSDVTYDTNALLITGAKGQDIVITPKARKIEDTTQTRRIMATVLDGSHGFVNIDGGANAFDVFKNVAKSDNATVNFVPSAGFKVQAAYLNGTAEANRLYLTSDTSYTVPAGSSDAHVYVRFELGSGTPKGNYPVTYSVPTTGPGSHGTTNVVKTNAAGQPVDKDGNPTTDPTKYAYEKSVSQTIPVGMQAPAMGFIPENRDYAFDSLKVVIDGTDVSAKVYPATTDPMPADAIATYTINDDESVTFQFTKPTCDTFTDDTTILVEPSFTIKEEKEFEWIVQIYKEGYDTDTTQTLVGTAAGDKVVGRVSSDAGTLVTNDKLTGKTRNYLTDKYTSPLLQFIPSQGYKLLSVATYVYTDTDAAPASEGVMQAKTSNDGAALQTYTIPGNTGALTTDTKNLKQVLKVVFKQTVSDGVLSGDLPGPPAITDAFNVIVDEVEGDGTVIPMKTIVPAYGSTTITFKPGDGQQVSKVKVRSGSGTFKTVNVVGDSLVLENITDDQTIRVEFDTAKPDYEVPEYIKVTLPTLNPVTQGEISPAGVSYVLPGGSLPININPIKGKCVDTITIKDVATGLIDTINVEDAINSGLITPVGEDDNIYFVLTGITSEKEISLVLDDSKEEKMVFDYTVVADGQGVVNPAAGQLSKVNNWTSDPISITPASADYGLTGVWVKKLTLNNTTGLKDETDVTSEFIPADTTGLSGTEGYQLLASKVKKDGNIFQLTNIHYEVKVIAKFELDPNKKEEGNYILATVGTKGGSITPAGNVFVPKSAGSKTFNFAPFNGYQVDKVCINGGNGTSDAEKKAASEGTYTFSNLTADGSIVVHFGLAAGYSATDPTLPNNLYPVTIVNTPTSKGVTFGTVSPSSIVFVPKGGSQAYVAKPTIAGTTVESIKIVDVNNGVESPGTAKLDRTSLAFVKSGTTDRANAIEFKVTDVKAPTKVIITWRQVNASDPNEKFGITVDDGQTPGGQPTDGVSPNPNPSYTDTYTLVPQPETTGGKMPDTGNPTQKININTPTTGGGTVTPSGEVEVPLDKTYPTGGKYGEQEIAIVPEPGQGVDLEGTTITVKDKGGNTKVYKLSDLIGPDTNGNYTSSDGRISGKVSPDGCLVKLRVNEGDEVSVDPKFKQMDEFYFIKVEVNGGNGTVSPDGGGVGGYIKVARGRSESFMLKPSTGYYVSEIAVYDTDDQFVVNTKRPVLTYTYNQSMDITKHVNTWTVFPDGSHRKLVVKFAQNTNGTDNTKYQPTSPKTVTPIMVGTAGKIWVSPAVRYQVEQGAGTTVSYGTNDAAYKITKVVIYEGEYSTKTEAEAQTPIKTITGEAELAANNAWSISNIQKNYTVVVYGGEQTGSSIGGIIGGGGSGSIVVKPKTSKAINLNKGATMYTDESTNENYEILPVTWLPEGEEADVECTANTGSEMTWLVVLKVHRNGAYTEDKRYSAEEIKKANGVIVHPVVGSNEYGYIFMSNCVPMRYEVSVNMTHGGEGFEVPGVDAPTDGSLLTHFGINFNEKKTVAIKPMVGYKVTEIIVKSTSFTDKPTTIYSAANGNLPAPDPNGKISVTVDGADGNQVVTVKLKNEATGVTSFGINVMSPAGHGTVMLNDSTTILGVDGTANVVLLEEGKTDQKFSFKAADGYEIKELEVQGKRDGVLLNEKYDEGKTTADYTIAKVDQAYVIRVLYGTVGMIPLDLGVRVGSTGGELPSWISKSNTINKVQYTIGGNTTGAMLNPQTSRFEIPKGAQVDFVVGPLFNETEKGFYTIEKIEHVGEGDGFNPDDIVVTAQQKAPTRSARTNNTLLGSIFSALFNDAGSMDANGTYANMYDVRFKSLASAKNAEISLMSLNMDDPSIQKDTLAYVSTYVEGGAIDPSGSQTCKMGEELTFTITPAKEGDTLKLLSVNGVDQMTSTGLTANADGSYTFKWTVVSTETVILAGLNGLPGGYVPGQPVDDSTKLYIQSEVVGTGGTISPSGLKDVARGSSQDFVINADANYMIKELVVDNIAEPKAKGLTSFTYPFTNIQKRHTIVVSFEPYKQGTSLPTTGNNALTTTGNQLQTGVQQAGNTALAQTGDRPWMLVSLLLVLVGVVCALVANRVRRTPATAGSRARYTQPTYRPTRRR